MKKRYKESVLEVDKGNFEVLEGTSGELTIKTPIVTANVYSENYITPPTPEGYKHVEGEWNNGFVIERCSDGSQFVWIPVGYLDPDGTLDGEHFSEKFGRRNYLNDQFSDEEFNEPLTGDLLEQFESVKKYGGFYISRYNISVIRIREECEFQSVKGAIPLTRINFINAIGAANKFENREDVKSHLPFGCEYDSVLAWFIKSGVRTLKDITKDSTDWGNYRDIESDEESLKRTGSNEEWCTNRIYDFTGNVNEWTQEKNGKDDYGRVIRGGSFIWKEGHFPAAYRNCCRATYGELHNSFRISLCIK